MMKVGVAASCVLLALAGTADALVQDRDLKNRPITKVVTLLKDMMTQMQAEADADEEAYETLGCWCKTNDKLKTQAIADGKKKIVKLNADIEKGAATSAGLNTAIANLQAELAKNQGALDTATALREKQLAEFTEEEKDMMQSIASLGSAVTTLGKHNKGALLQLSDSEEIDVMTTMKSILRRHKDLLAEVVSPKERRMVEAFAQTPDGYFDQAPRSMLEQASKYQPEYAPASGQIFGVLKQMKETFEANLAKSQEEETLNQQSYEDMKEAKTSEIKAGTDQSNVKSAQLAETDEKHAQAKEDLVTTEASLAADIDYLANLKSHCANIDQEYEERVKTRGMEMNACSKAMAVLTSDEAGDLFSSSLGLAQKTSLLQTRSRALQLQAIVAEKLQAAAKAVHDPRLSTLAARVRLDAFGKVKESLQGMIDNLLKEKDDEIKQKDYCIDAMNTNMRTTEIKEREKADAVAKIEDHTVAIDALTASIKKDNEEIASMRVQLKKLSEDREKANKDFQMTVADQRATQKLLSAALGVLKGFYEKPALVQSSKAAAADKKQPAGPPPPPGFAKAGPSAASGGVMNMLQTIINDAKAMEAEALEAESQAQEQYEATVTDTNAAVQEKQEDIVQKTENKAKEEEDKVSTEATRDEKILDIEQLKKENLDLHFSCDYMIKNFDLRMEARDAEVEALKQGLATFSGASFSAFLQGHK